MIDNSGFAAVADDGSNERADVARRIFELSETITEALDYMLAQFDAFHTDMGVLAALIKDVGDGFISLENAVSSISEPSGLNTEAIQKLDYHFSELSEWLDAVVDACVENRAADLPALGESLRDAYKSYGAAITRNFRKMAVM